MARARDDFARLLDGDGSGSGPEGSGRALEALVLARRELDAATAVRPEFRDALRTRLLAVAAVQADAPAPARTAPAALLQSVRARRRAAALSGALAGVVALTGVGVAAGRSAPGDVFYAAKRTAEDVRLGLASKEAGVQGLRRLQLATARLSELEALSASGRTLGLVASPSAAGRPLAAGASRSDVLDVLDDMDEDVRDGFALMLDAYRADGDRASLEVVRGWSVEQAARLRALLPRLSPALQQRGEGSLTLVREVEAEVVRLLAAPPSGPGPAELEDPLPPDTSSVVQDGPSASAVPTPSTAPQGPLEDGPAQPGTGPRPLSPAEGDDGPVSQPAVADDDPAPRPPAPPLPPRPPKPPRAGLPSAEAPLPEPGVPSAGLPTVDLPGPDLPSSPSLPEPLPDLPDLPVDGLPAKDVPAVR